MRGARVVVNDLDEAPAQETLAALERAGGEAHAVVVTSRPMASVSASSPRPWSASATSTSW